MHHTCRVVFVNFSSKLSLLDVLVAIAIAIAIAVVVAKVSWCLGNSSLPPFPPPPYLPEDPDPVVTYISVGYFKLLYSRVYPLVVFKA